MANNRMKEYIAPDGFVYDFAEPRYRTINEELVEEHLYVKYLYLGRFDNITNYKLVEDPRGEE